MTKLLHFFFEIYFERGTPKMYANQLKDACNGFHFFEKIAGWESAVLSKACFSTSIFHDFYSDLYCSYL